ncbi:SDR family oxidoreductase [Burkholderia lata]|nr:SDR family oxidoreductase [Burkholderia sp. HI2714]
MKIVVIGGTGLTGRKVINNLRGRSHEVVAAAPSTGVNTTTGEGLSYAISGAEIAINLENPSSFEEVAVKKFLETAAHNLFTAERAAAARHHAVLPVVGTHRLEQSACFRGKIIQEDLNQESGVPYTIVRPTRLFEFLGAIVQSRSEDEITRLSTAYFEPIASDDVAAPQPIFPSIPHEMAPSKSVVSTVCESPIS